MADRVGARVRLDLVPDLVVSAARREALIRITREAVSNAARHGRASTISVELASAPELRLRVSDDGVGFSPAAAGAAHGFGLVSMRERAQALGGTFRVSSAPGRGTEVEVLLP